MNQMQLTFSISYLLMTCYFFSNWLRFSLRHHASTPEDKFLSLIMCLMTIIFWPLMILMSVWEIFKKRKIDINTTIPVILVVFAVSFSYYLIYLYEHGFCYKNLFCSLAS
ncbi:hypothetical protein [Anabaena sp. CCY 9614]|uniref:hypothetical protein n=1 Tax=Anabaena sp. CCY 9614 TaxID=3103869 RepID=UPI0039C5F517